MTKNLKQVFLTPWQAEAIQNDYKHFAMLTGIACGKTYTGSHFAIKQMIERPTLTGLIAANTYDQLSQATLRELLYWLDQYEIQYVIDEQPPTEWGYKKKQFKSYRNILSVFIAPHIVTMFTRVLSDGDALRGIEFSWYWMDESRDTPMNTHDIILSRMRESDYIKGLVTSTTNGQDWCYDRFVKNAVKGDKTFGSMHVSTRDSVAHGIVTEDFLNTLLKSYSPMMVAQEIDALHVNVHAGRAYYAASEKNKMRRAPWGDEYPDPERPLVLGCDFNFSPSPCVWLIGQLSPMGDEFHWFDEISELETGTREMIKIVAYKYPDFYMQIFGDASGEKGTTSNMGEHDYHQISDELFNLGIDHNIDVNPSNPLVKDRVENVNRLLCDGVGNITITYDPQRCPLLDADFRLVGWKVREGTAKAKLNANGNSQLTHASDAIGYAMFKVFPPGRRMEIIPSIESTHRKVLGSAF